MAWSPRRTLLAMTLGWGCALILWGGVSLIDLGDGQTWAHHRRFGRALLEAEGFQVNDFGFYRVRRETHPTTFEEIVMLRGVMPAIFFAVFAGVSALGWAAQPRTPVDV